MRYISSGEYARFKGKDYYLFRKRREEDWLPIGYYIGSEKQYIDEKWTTIMYKEGPYYERPITSDEIEYLYEIDYYVICNGRKYESFIRSKGESELWVYACSNYNRDNIELDSKYRVVEDGRDGVFLAVPFEDVELYETKTYYDKDKFINEDERVVLSEETYLIDEPWWLEETKDN